MKKSTFPFPPNLFLFIAVHGPEGKQSARASNRDSWQCSAIDVQQGIVGVTGAGPEYEERDGLKARACRKPRVIRVLAVLIVSLARSLTSPEGVSLNVTCDKTAISGLSRLSCSSGHWFNRHVETERFLA